MDSAVMVLFCATLVAIAYLVIEYIRTTYLVTMVLGEPAPLVAWVIAAGLMLVVAVPTTAVIKGWISISLPIWVSLFLLVVGWWLLYAGAIVAFVAACYNISERRQVLREYPGRMEECA